MTLCLHYRGDVTPFDGSQVLGPDRDSGLYKATSAVYDADSDRTTVTVRPLSLDERHEYVQKSWQPPAIPPAFVGPAK